MEDGIERKPKVKGKAKELARRLLDGGARLLPRDVGFGAPVPQPVPVPVAPLPGRRALR